MTTKIHTLVPRTEAKGVKPSVNPSKHYKPSQGLVGTNKGMAFSERLQVKQQAEEDERDRVKFKKLLSYAYPDEKVSLLQAIEAGDRDGYMAVVRPIVNRMVLKEFNNGEWSE